jgi:hypothetical protein
VLPMEVKIEASKTIQTAGAGSDHNMNRNNWVVGGLPYATVSMGPLLFALPLEKKGSEWQYALVLDQKPTLKRKHTIHVCDCIARGGSTVVAVGLRTRCF